MIANLIKGLLIALPITGILCLLRRIFYVPLRREAWIKQAIAKRHSAQAKLVHRPRDSYDREARDYWLRGQEASGGRSKWDWFVYAFTYNNREYKVRMRIEGRDFYNPPAERTVYWRRKPSKASQKEAFGGTEGRWIVLWIVLGVLFALFMCTATPETKAAVSDKLIDLINNGVIG